MMAGRRSPSDFFSPRISVVAWADLCVDIGCRLGSRPSLRQDIDAFDPKDFTFLSASGERLVGLKGFIDHRHRRVIIQQDSLPVILSLNYPWNWPVADFCTSGYKLPAAAFVDEQASVGDLRPIAPSTFFHIQPANVGRKAPEIFVAMLRGPPSDTCECWLGEGMELPEMPVDGQQPVVFCKDQRSRSLLRASPICLFD